MSKIHYNNIYLWRTQKSNGAKRVPETKHNNVIYKVTYEDAMFNLLEH